MVAATLWLGLKVRTVMRKLFPQRAAGSRA
jgi:hypothetical protein